MGQPILFYDYETTGVDPRKDRPIQIGVCDTEGRIYLNTYCNPCMPIAEEATKVHGISSADLVGFPDYLCAIFSQLQIFKGFESPIVAGFNTSVYDDVMLESCYGEGSLSSYRKLDVLDVVYRYYPTLEKKKLVDLHQHFLGQELTGAHGAIQDCIGTANVLKAVCMERGSAPSELAKELETPQVYPILPIGKHRGRHVEDVPYSWANWMLSNATNMRQDLEATVRWISENNRR